MNEIEDEMMGEWVDVVEENEESESSKPSLVPSYEDGGEGWALGV